jgi:hypothetical protein
MASMVLGIAGQAAFGPVGGFVGGLVGGVIDSILFAPDPVNQEGPRLANLDTQANAPGAPITIPYGQAARTAGALIWTSSLKETAHTVDVEGGKGFGGPEATVTTYTYAVDVAILVCEGPIAGITKIWANNKLLYEDGSFSRADDIRVAPGSQTQSPDSLLEAAEGVGAVPAFRGNCVVFIENLQLADFGNATPGFRFEVKRAATPDTVRHVVGDLCARAGMTAAETDIDMLPLEVVPGYAVRDVTTPRAAIEQLQKVYPFDAADTGYQLQFRTRNRLGDAVVLAPDLAAHPAGDASPPTEPTVRGLAEEIPVEITLGYFDPARELDVNLARSLRLATRSNKVASFKLPMTLSATRAKRAIDDLATEMWLQRTRTTLRLPVKYLGLDAGDVIRIARAGNVLSQPYRIQRIALGADGVLEAEVTPHLFRWARSEAPADSAASAVRAQVVPQFSGTTLFLLDLPLLSDETPDTAGFYSAVQDAGDQNRWDGAWLYRAPDGTTFSRRLRLDAEVTGGSAVTALPVGATDYPDVKNSLRVRFDVGVPANTTDDGLQRGDNTAVLGAHGRWEVVQFRDAALVSGTTYDLTHLIRGGLGTEYAVLTHMAGDGFFVLDAATVRRETHEQALLDAAVDYKGVTFFQAVASATAQSFADAGQSFMPWSPVNVVGTRDGSGNLIIDWQRRNRRFWSGNPATPQMSEESERYELDFRNASAVLRTITVSSESASYPASAQVTDFGSVQASVIVDIFQISATVGRGHKRRETV